VEQEKEVSRVPLHSIRIRISDKNGTAAYGELLMLTWKRLLKGEKFMLIFGWNLRVMQ
jgi:hypothetical protein